VALKDVRDGHDFLAQAFVSGASAALISDESKADGLGPALVVADVLEVLRKLGVAARDRSVAKRVAVTGSVGKTSTKEALAICLSASGATHRSVKSYNNHWGVPLTLSRMPRESQFAVFEIGMNHRGEILPLTQLVKPHAALVTTIAPAHVENLGSLEAVADEKGDIYAGLEPGGAAIVPAEAPHAERLIAAAERNGANLIRFGRRAECEARLLSFDMDETGSNAQAEILGRAIRYRVGVEARIGRSTPSPRSRARTSSAPIWTRLRTRSNICAPSTDAAWRSASRRRSALSCLWTTATTPTPLRWPRRFPHLRRASPEQAAGASWRLGICWNSAPTSTPIMRAWRSPWNKPASIWCSPQVRAWRRSWRRFPRRVAAAMPTPPMR
jgi:hypothetical protein